MMALGLAMAGAAHASVIQIEVFTALAPNAYGSPSYWGTLSNPGWVPNAITSLTTALATGGTPGTVGSTGPTQFALQSTVDAKDLNVTSFNSWLGTADPGTVFGPDYANELGNRGSFPLIIDGNSSQFSISELSFQADSSDGGDSLGFGFAAGHYNYGSDYVGIEFNGNPTNPAAWTFITSGANTQLVDALVGRGSGNGGWPCGPGDISPCSTIAEQQADIDATSAPLDGRTFTGTYTLAGQSASATFNINAPEPSTFFLLGFSGIALSLTRARNLNHLFGILKSLRR